jgi:hypothetical protein
MYLLGESSYRATSLTLLQNMPIVSGGKISLVSARQANTKKEVFLVSASLVRPTPLSSVQIENNI